MATGALAAARRSLNRRAGEARDFDPRRGEGELARHADLGRFLRRVKRRAVVAQLGAGPQLAEVAADDMAVDDRQANAADRRGQGEEEFELDARAWRDGHGDDRVELALQLMLAQFDHRALAGRMLGGIGEGGQLAELRPALAEYFEHIMVERRLQRLMQLLADVIPGELHPADSFVVAHPVADPVGDRIEPGRQQVAERDGVSQGRIPGECGSTPAGRPAPASRTRTTLRRGRAAGRATAPPWCARCGGRG